MKTMCPPGYRRNSCTWAHDVITVHHAFYIFFFILVLNSILQICYKTTKMFSVLKNLDQIYT